MSILEEKIRKNRDVFDGAEPSEGHYERFQEKLSRLHGEEPLPGKSRTRKLFRVAAVLAALAGLSVTYYLVNPLKSPDIMTASTLPAEILEARVYYDKVVNEKMKKIDDCAVSASEASNIRKIISEEILLLDSSSVQLEQELQKDRQNSRLIHALIRNYKTKSDLIDNIINRICHI